MTDDEHLSAALARDLKALVSDLEPSRELRDWVSSELCSEPHVPARARWRLRWRVLATLTPATVGAALAALFLASQASPSFAVSRTSNGAVRITLHDIEGVTGADAKLRKLGITSVAVIPVRSGCRSRVRVLFTGIGAHGTTVTVTPSEIPRHMIDILAAKQIAPGSVALGLGRVRSPAPPCVAPAKSGVGLPAKNP
jgi:hypothetical protein